MKVMEIDASGPDDAGDREQMYRVRARIFGGRLGWRVDIRDGLERDYFDELAPSYLVLLTEDEHVCGSVRLLPAMGETMLSRAFPQLADKGSFKADGTMVESSRFGIDTYQLALKPGLAAGDATRLLLAGIVEWCLARNYKTLVTVTDLRMERLLRRLGWLAHRLGPPCDIDGAPAIAATLVLSEPMFHKLRPAAYQAVFKTASQKPGD
nr:autoinducer synthesis protein [Rhizobium sp. Q54]